MAIYKIGIVANKNDQIESLNALKMTIITQ